jgi:arginyl-tRNA synthetase
LGIEEWKLNSKELAVLRTLPRFIEVVEQSARNYAPNLLCNYLYVVAQKYNAFYNKHRIIGSKSEDIRIKLTESVGQVLKNGLGLLGIETPVRM